MTTIYVILWSIILAPFITCALIGIYKLMGYILYLRWRDRGETYEHWQEREW